MSALVFGASSVDAVEINPIIANDVMRDRFKDFSGGIYTHPRVRVFVDDGRSFVRRSEARYDIIQASLVDTWAATAAGAYTLTENTLYTVEAFDDYLDHLTDDGVLTITRWVFDGLRLVSLAQAACEARGWDAASRLAIIQHDRVATFLLKKTPFTAAEVARLREVAAELRFNVLYAPSAPPDPAGALSAAGSDNTTDEWIDGTATGDYARLILAPDRERFYAAYPQDIRPTTDDRPFFFHTTKLADQFDVAFGRSMLFGNGLSALLTLMGISGALVVLFVLGPLAVAAGSRPPGWLAWLGYFGALGAGFMLIEVAVLQRFVLLLGHPVFALTVTLFSLLLGTGLGAALSRRLAGPALEAIHGADDCRHRDPRRGLRRRRHAAGELGDSIRATRPHRDRGDGARPDWNGPGRADARRHSAAARARAADADVGLGHERRAVGRGRDAGDLHRHELGISGDPARGLRHLPDGARLPVRGGGLDTVDFRQDLADFRFVNFCDFRLSCLETRACRAHLRRSREEHEEFFSLRASCVGVLKPCRQELCVLSL